METGGPAAFRLGFDAEGLAPLLVAGWANLRTRALDLPYGDQGCWSRGARMTPPAATRTSR